MCGSVPRYSPAVPDGEPRFGSLPARAQALRPLSCTSWHSASPPPANKCGGRARNLWSFRESGCFCYRCSMPVASIKWIPNAGGGGHLELLDQTKLPLATDWIACNQAAEVIDAIKRLAVRGAPAIGIAGAYAYCLAAQHTFDSASDVLGATSVASDGRPLTDRIVAQSALIADARPTAVNLQWAVNRMNRVLAKYAFAFLFL